MPNVYAWPPVTIMAWRNTISRPGSISRGLNGRSYYSQAQAARAMYACQVLDTGRSRGDAGYIDMLRRLCDGKPGIVRIKPAPPIWWAATRGLQGLRGAEDLVWLSDGRDLDWTSGSDDLVWTTGTTISATAEADGDWDAIRCTGLPASRYVAFAGEIVAAETGETARVLKHEKSDADGEALIRLDGAIPTGNVIIGVRESLMMQITRWPDNILGTAPGEMRFEMTEVFDTDFSSFTEVDPWS
jgi:hypothetical protein